MHHEGAVGGCTAARAPSSARVREMASSKLRTTTTSAPCGARDASRISAPTLTPRDARSATSAEQTSPDAPVDDDQISQLHFTAGSATLQNRRAL